MQSDVEQLAERVLSELPDWIWDGKSLPVPVEHIADTWFGLHVRDVEDLRSAPGVPPLPPDAGLSGLLLPAAGEIWVNAAEARERVRASYGDNYDRLAQIKAKYDPDNIFRVNQNIQPQA